MQGGPLLRTKSHFIAQLILDCLIKANSLPSWPQPGPWIISLEVHRLKGSCSLESPLNLRPNSVWKAELKPSSPHDQMCSACVLKIGAFYLKINRVSHIKPMGSQKKKNTEEKQWHNHPAQEIKFYHWRKKSFILSSPGLLFLCNVTLFWHLWRKCLCFFGLYLNVCS